jgi:cobalt-zinc-cadmium resistance protein CzcA
MTTEPVVTNEAPPRGILERVLAASIRNRWLVLAAAIGVAVLGIFNFARLPIDAIPDITNVQVQINTAVEGLSPLEVEKRITFPIETAMTGIPGLEMTRSLSRYGLSQVTVVFEDGTDIYFARQLINERLQEARASLPQGFAEPELGPIATGLGEIFMWTVEARPGATKPDGTPYTTVDLREVQDWIVRPQLRGVPGVTEINTIGGYRKQYEVTPDPHRLIAYGLTFHDLLLAIESNNSEAGGGFIEEKGEQVLVSSSGRLQSLDQIADVVVATRNGVPLRLKEVAAVGVGRELRTGAATMSGEEVVLGTAFMLIGENSRTVSHRLAARLEEVNRTLPAGVFARPIYDRTKLVEATLETVKKNLLEGAALVIAVLFLLLGNITAAILVALVIPLSMLIAVTGMVEGRISANLLSLGAIDFGIIVDGAVVMVENILRRFAERRHVLGRPLSAPERLRESFAASAEAARPTLFGVAIIMIVYIPILTLTGIEAKMFQPMAKVVLLALAGALVLTFTFVPAAVAMFLRAPSSESPGRLMSWAKKLYAPTLNWSLRHRIPVLVVASVFFLACSFLAAQLGSEFVPSLDEGDIAVHALRIPGTGLQQAVEMQSAVEKTIEAFPEVDYTYAKIGTAEIATDPMPPAVADVFVIMKSRREWPDPRRSKHDVVGEMEEKLSILPGNVYEFTQPIAMRFNELIAGIRSDVAVKVFGDDLEQLLEVSHEIEEVLRGIPGAADVKTEQVTGLPMMTIEVDRMQAARFGLSTNEVQEVIRTALAGTIAGEVFEGDRRFEIVVRLAESAREDLQSLSLLPVPLPAVGGSHALMAGMPAFHAPGRTEFVPLGMLAKIKLDEGPNQVSRENGKRRIVVQSNVRGRDLGSFVAEAQSKVRENVDLPEGTWISWGGQFENLIAARARLALVIPLSLLLIFILLTMAFGSAIDALLVFSGVPLALTGGVIALAVRGIPFSITAGIGFIALFGVAVLNGLVMVSFIRKLREDGLDWNDAIRQGSETRLRPVLMTALVASLGFLPMALATGTGAEVQRPLATVVIGGVLSSTLLTLVVLPSLYSLVRVRR